VDAQLVEEPPALAFALAEHELLGMEETARGAKAVVEADAARSNHDEKCRTFMIRSLLLLLLMLLLMLL